MEQRDVVRSTGVCAVSGRQLNEGEEHYAVLFEEGDSFRRVDYGLEAWTGPPEGAYCFFKTRLPVRQQKKTLLVDNDMLVNFFLRLGEETQAARLQFRFVLALMLMRKRLWRYEQTVHTDGEEYWQMRLVQESSLHRVLNPHLTDEQIESVSRQLGAILHGDWADGLDSVEATGQEIPPTESRPDAPPVPADPSQAPDDDEAGHA
ncbi:MAG: hypothetical protein ACYS7M_11475 [Planctomycetota bacterium]|jgi:hypothetical protein